MANTTKPAFDPWDVKAIEGRAPDAASVVAARKLLTDRKAFGKVEPRADGLGWWAVCKGMTGTYQVSVKRGPRGGLHDDCTCPSYKKPCKHALALLIYLAEHPEARPEPDAPKDALPRDLEPLLRAVFANPADDLRRLVLADFVEEQGDAERAALIRVQCELSQVPTGAPPAQDLKDQETKLVAAIRKRFHPLPDRLTLTFDRGFARLKVRWGQLKNPGALPGQFLDLFREGWVESVRFDGWYDAIGRDAIPFFRQVGELDFRSMQLDAQVLIAIAADLPPGQPDSRLTRVLVPERYEGRFAELLAQRADTEAAPPDEQETPATPPALPSNQVQNGITAARITLLARQGYFRPVRNLHLNRGLGDDGAAALAVANGLGQLLSLHLNDVDIGPDGLAALASSKVLTRLETLLVQHTSIGDAGTVALATHLNLPRLRALFLQGADIGDAGAKALAKSTGMADVQGLSLADNAVGPAGAVALLRSRALRRLNSLNLSNNPIPTEKQLPAVVGAASRPQLMVGFTDMTVVRNESKSDRGRWDLTITGAGNSPVHEGAFDALPDAPGINHVHSLTIARMRFTPDEIVRLTEVVARLPVRALHLPNNHLRNDDIQALAERLDTLSLDVLDLSHNEIGVAGAKALASAPGLSRIRELNLSHNPLRPSGLEALAATEHRAALRHLIVRGADLDAGQRQAVRDSLGRKVKVEF